MHYLQEWQESCVDEQLTRLNVTALEGDRPYDYLFYADSIPRRNDGRIGESLLKRYQHLENGGWWCSGIDILTGDNDLWGCFKPISPRLSLERHKPIKYEHPPQTSTGVFALKVPLHLWEKISERYNQPILAEEIDPEQPDSGFWQWLMKYPQIPLCITEGAKKAGALLTAGYAAIALPGVNGGYRVPRNEFGDSPSERLRQRIGKARLIPQLQKLTRDRRPIYIVFDRDRKPNTIKAVNAAIRQTGYLLTQQGCDVKIITWNPEWGKGVDDLISEKGLETFDRAYKTAPTLETWKALALTQLTHPVHYQLNCRYLSDLTIPQEARLIGLKSPKGTGKTQFLEKVVKQAIAEKKWVLIIGHRVRLVESLCQRFGLNYITEVCSDRALGLLGYGLCIDSLHPNSQAQFNAANWQDGIVIIDEVEQVLWHGLNSKTCQGNRVAILRSLKTLMQNVLGGDGKVYVADADLTDVSLDYLIALAGINLQPFIIRNDWQPDREDAWPIYHYPDEAPDRLVGDLEAHIAEGGRPFVCLSAQKLKSQWGTRNLEAYLKEKFPRAKILRIDSESLADPTHAAYGCMNNLNNILRYYDIVLASPSIETGVSIDLKGHFTSVWAIAQGIQSENSVRQAIGRIRENIPRYLWIASFGFNQVGNGSTSIPTLLNSGQRLTQLNVKLLQRSDFAALDDLETGFQAESLLCWAKFAVRFNAATLEYRRTILTALLAEGHIVEEKREEKKRIGEEEKKPKEQEINGLKAAIAEVRDRNYQEECEAIAFAADINEQEYKILKKQLVKTSSQRRTLRKYELLKRYGLEITPDLVVKDDNGWYTQLRLHYFLTVGRKYLADRDATNAKQLLTQGEGKIFAPDFNRSQLGAKIGTMEVLGIPVLLEHPERELRNSDRDLKALQKIAIDNRAFIKMVLGIGIAKNASPVLILRRFLEQIGYGVKCIKCEGERINSKKTKRIRVYNAVIPDDGRFAVFAQWLAKEETVLIPDGFLEENPATARKLKQQPENEQNNFIQLSLF
ncbi:MAG: plasmid replication protein, CyRepA1 family [Spirulina sp.]